MRRPILHLRGNRAGDRCPRHRDDHRPLRGPGRRSASPQRVGDPRPGHRVLPSPRGRATRTARADRAQLGRLYLERARERGDPADLIRAEESARHSLALRHGTERRGLRHPRLQPPGTAPLRRSARRPPNGCSRSTAPRSGPAAWWARSSWSSDATRRRAAPSACSPCDAPIPRSRPGYARWEEITRAARGGAPAAPRGAGRRRPAARHARGTARLVSTPPRGPRHASGPSRGGRPGIRARAWHSSPTTIACSAPWRGSQLAAGAGSTRRSSTASARSAACSIPRRSACSTTRTRRWATGRGPSSTARAMEVAVLSQPGPLHRAWSMFLLDHDRDVAAVLARAQEEIRTRQDVYGWDLLAWALHHVGPRCRSARRGDPCAGARHPGRHPALSRRHDRPGPGRHAPTPAVTCGGRSRSIPTGTPRSRGPSRPCWTPCERHRPFPRAGIPPHHGPGGARPSPVPGRARRHLSRARLAGRALGRQRVHRRPLDHAGARRDRRRAAADRR